MINRKQRFIRKQSARSLRRMLNHHVRSHTAFNVITSFNSRAPNRRHLRRTISISHPSNTSPYTERKLPMNSRNRHLGNHLQRPNQLSILSMTTSRFQTVNKNRRTPTTKLPPGNRAPPDNNMTTLGHLSHLNSLVSEALRHRTRILNKRQFVNSRRRHFSHNQRQEHPRFHNQLNRLTQLDESQARPINRVGRPVNRYYPPEQSSATPVPSPTQDTQSHRNAAQRIPKAIPPQPYTGQRPQSNPKA